MSVSKKRSPGTRSKPCIYASALHSPARQFSACHDFETTSFTLSAGAARLRLGAGSDPFCNGGAIAQTATLESAVTTPFTVCLSVDLQAVSYNLALDTGCGFAVLGSTAVDSFAAPQRRERNRHAPPR